MEHWSEIWTGLTMCEHRYFNVAGSRCKVTCLVEEMASISPGLGDEASGRVHVLSSGWDREPLGWGREKCGWHLGDREWS